MFKKLDQVFAKLGNMRAMERLHVDTFTEDQINNVPGDKIAESTQGQLFAGVTELNGFLFLETVIICGEKIKTFNGAQLSFSNGEDSFELKSDTLEIESEFSNVSNRYMSSISFDVTAAELDKIRNGEFQEVTFTWKKKSLRFITCITDQNLGQEEE